MVDVTEQELALAHEFGLSNTESSIAALIYNGLDTYQISNKLFVSRRTVTWHLTSIYKKANVRNKIYFILAAHRLFESKKSNTVKLNDEHPA